MLNSLRAVNWFGVEPRLHTHAKPSVYTHTNPKILITAIWQIFPHDFGLLLYTIVIDIVLSTHDYNFIITFFYLEILDDTLKIQSSVDNKTTIEKVHAVSLKIHQNRRSTSKLEIYTKTFLIDLKLG